MTENGQKVAPKFKIEFLKREAPNDPLLQELKHWCSEFHRLDLAPLYPGGSYGNLSFRPAAGSDQFIITASALALKEDLPDDRFVEVIDVDLKNMVVKANGKRPPSSESLLHSMIYSRRPDINAIFHGHSKEILSSGKRMNIPATEREEPYGSLALVEAALPLALEHDLFILKDHGFVSLGQNMSAAGKLAVEALRIARLNISM